MDYCQDAWKLLKINVICGKDCPLYGYNGDKCPRLILQNANYEADDINNQATNKAIEALLKTREETNERKNKP